MTSHHHPGVVIPLHRMVALPVKSLDDIVREANEAHPDLIEQLRERQFIRPSLLERVADFFAGDRGISFMLGAYSGAMLTVAAAIVWTFAL